MQTCAFVCLCSQKITLIFLASDFPVFGDLSKQMRKGRGWGGDGVGENSLVHAFWHRPNFPIFKILSRFPSPHHCIVLLERHSGNSYGNTKKKKKEATPWGWQRGNPLNRFQNSKRAILSLKRFTRKCGQNSKIMMLEKITILGIVTWKIRRRTF